MLGCTRRHIWLQRGHTQKERRGDVVGCAPVVVNVPPLLGVPELQQIRHLSHSTRKMQHALCVVKWEVSSSIRGGITKLNRLLLDISTHVSLRAREGTTALAQIWTRLHKVTLVGRHREKTFKNEWEGLYYAIVSCCLLHIPGVPTNAE